MFQSAHGKHDRFDAKAFFSRETYGKSFTGRPGSPLPEKEPLRSPSSQWPLPETTAKHTGDLFAFYERLLQGDYFSQGQQLSQGDAVIDVGANIGCFVIAASKRVGETRRVIETEPNASTFESLSYNIAGHDPAAISSKLNALGFRKKSFSDLRFYSKMQGLPEPSHTGGGHSRFSKQRLGLRLAAGSPAMENDQQQGLSSLTCNACKQVGRWRAISTRRRHNSMIALADCRGCGARLFLKTFVDHEGISATRVAHDQYRLAEELSRRFDSSGALRVPRPLAIFDATMAMEYINGRPASAAIQASAPDAQDRLLECIGRWFASYHTAMACEDLPADFSEKCERLRDRSAKLSSHHPIRAAIARLESSRHRFDGRSFRCARLHGDAKPDNFLVARDAFYGIDIQAAYRNLVEYDLAQFLCQMLLSTANVVRCRRHPRAEAMEAALLRGYAQLGPYDEAALGWLRTYFFASLWLNAPAAGFTQRWLRPLLMKELDLPAGEPKNAKEMIGDEYREPGTEALGREHPLSGRTGRPRI